MLRKKSTVWTMTLPSGTQTPDRSREHRVAHFGATSSATARHDREFLERLGPRESGLQRRRPRFFHLREIVELLHKAAVDPILEPPHGRAFHRPAPAGSDGIAVAGGNQRQESFLGSEGPRRLAEQDSAQVVGEGPTLANREHTCLGTRMSYHIGDIPRSEHGGIG